MVSSLAAVAGGTVAVVIAKMIGSEFGGCKAEVFAALFLGVPIGAIVPIAIMEEGKKTYKMIASVVGFFLSGIGMYGCVYLADEIGTKIFLMAPVLSALLVIATFHIRVRIEASTSGNSGLR